MEQAFAQKVEEGEVHFKIVYLRQHAATEWYAVDMPVVVPEGMPDARVFEGPLDRCCDWIATLDKE